jgi:hypothetical protein
MYEKASKRNRQFIKDNKVQLLFGDFITTDINLNGFDKIYFTNVIYFWDNLQKPFEKLNSLLKNEGEIFFFMAGKEYLQKQKVTNEDVFNKYSIEEICESLKSAGFRDVNWFFEKGYYIKAKK